MKKNLVLYGLAILLAGSYSCKGKKDNKGTETTTATTPTPTTTAPVEISQDDQLRTGVKDATKDFPDVNATVQNGVITLDGSIEKSRYLTLKQSLDALRPKQVVNNLKYK